MGKLQLRCGLPGELLGPVLDPTLDRHQPVSRDSGSPLLPPSLSLNDTKGRTPFARALGCATRFAPLKSTCAQAQAEEFHLAMNPKLDWDQLSF